MRRKEIEPDRPGSPNPRRRSPRVLRRGGVGPDARRLDPFFGGPPFGRTRVGTREGSKVLNTERK